MNIFWGLFIDILELDIITWVHEIFMNVPDQHLGMRIIWDIYEISMRYLWDIYEIYMRYIWEIYEIYVRYIWDIYECSRWLLQNHHQQTKLSPTRAFSPSAEKGPCLLLCQVNTSSKRFKLGIFPVSNISCFKHILSWTFPDEKTLKLSRPQYVGRTPATKQELKVCDNRTDVQRHPTTKISNSFCKGKTKGSSALPKWMTFQREKSG